MFGSCCFIFLSLSCGALSCVLGSTMPIQQMSGTGCPDSDDDPFGLSECARELNHRWLEHGCYATAGLTAEDSDQLAEANSDEFGQAIKCDACNMWLNGMMAWEDHQMGKKHKKHVWPKKSRLGLTQSKVEPLALHPFSVESVLVSTSQATARIEAVCRELPVGSTTRAERRQRAQKKTRKRMRRRSNTMKANVAMRKIPHEAAESKQCCSQCGGTVDKCKLCSGCYSVTYCSKMCQNSHWRSTHKKDCATLHGLMSRTSERASGSCSGSQDSRWLPDIPEPHSEDAPPPDSVSVVDRSFNIALPVRMGPCSESEWTLVDESGSEPDGSDPDSEPEDETRSEAA